MFLILTSSAAQDTSEKLLQNITAYNNAFLTKNYDLVVEMTIPSIIEKGGGKEWMTGIIKEGVDTYTQANITYLSITPEDPGQIIQSKDENLFTILPQEIVLNANGKRYSKTNYYLAISTDGGNNWHFTDLEAYDKESIKTFVPNFPDQLNFPNFAVPIQKQK